MPDVSPARLREFFNPASVAMVGATDSFRMSAAVPHNLDLHGFAGELYLVNPRSPQVHGRPTIPSLSAIRGPVDLAFVVLGGERVIKVAEEAAELGIRNLVVLSGGFGESGPEGAELQRRLVEIAAAGDQVILGPNTIGFANVAGSAVMFGTRCPEPISAGPVSIVSQSGIMLPSSIRELTRRDVGFSTLAGVGNEAVMSIDNVIDYLVEDEATKVIGLFLETTRDAAGFRRAAGRALAAGKPIVALSGARTAVTAGFAVTHTGALVGDHAVQQAAFAELGVISVTSLEDFYATVAYLSRNRPLRGRRLAYTAVSGGKCEMFADRAVELGLELPPLAETTQAGLRDTLPSFGTTRNPLDCTGAANPELIIEAIQILAADPQLDAVVYDSSTLLLEGRDEARLEANARRLGAVTAAAPIPVLPVGFTYTLDLGKSPDFELTRRHGLGYEIGGFEHGILAMERSAWWTGRRAENQAGPALHTGANRAGALPSVREYLSRPRTEAAALDLLDAAGVGTVPHQVCESSAQAAKAAASFGFPVAIKVSSPDIAHKSRIGGVALNVTDEEVAAAAYASVVDAAHRAHPDADIEGVLVTPMRAGGIELIAGIHRDPAWGPVLMLGFGGVWVETLQDSALSLLPTTRARVERQLRGLRGAPLFAGGHGLEPADVDAVARHVLALTTLALDLGDQLQSLEINPLRVHGDVVEVLDALVVLAGS